MPVCAGRWMPCADPDHGERKACLVNNRDDKSCSFLLLSACQRDVPDPPAPFTGLVLGEDDSWGVMRIIKDVFSTLSLHKCQAHIWREGVSSCHCGNHVRVCGTELSRTGNSK